MSQDVTAPQGRYFFAVYSDQWRREVQIKDVVVRLKRDVKKREWDCHWTPPENYHVTISFLGGLTEEQVAACRMAGEDAAEQLSPFMVELANLGAFPEIEVGRVLWIGVRKSQKIMTVFEVLTDRLRRRGLPIEEREFLPHLTLCRLRTARNLTDWMSPFRRRNFAKYRIERLELLRSQNFGPRIVFETICSWRLSGNDSALPE